jgi:DNA adenine methylase
VPRLRLFWGDGYDRYIEPFAGSAALFFALQPRKALLNDINRELIFAFKQIRTFPEDVYDEVQRYPPDSGNFYRIRKLLPESLEPLQRAARFVFLNRFCFNGLYRTDQVGHFNVPFAASGTGALPAREHFLAAARLLRRASLKCDDFEKIILKHVRKGDFVYLDPPYAVGNRRVFRQYDPRTFGTEDLKRLGKALKEIDHRGAWFVVSYAYCREALECLAMWRTRRIYAHRNISGFARHRGLAAELVATNIENDDSTLKSSS